MAVLGEVRFLMREVPLLLTLASSGAGGLLPGNDKNERAVTSCASRDLFVNVLQGYLAHKKLPPPRTLQQAYVQGLMKVR